MASVSVLLDYARQQYGSTNDDFFSDSELYRHLWAAQSILATQAPCIRKLFTTTSVDGQQEYAVPTNFIALHRVQFNGEQCRVVSLDQILDATEGFISSVGGEPIEVAEWGGSLYFAPIPAADGQTIKIWAFVDAQEVTGSSSLEVPARHHFKLVNYLLWMKAIKDKNTGVADRYKQAWEQDVARAKDEEARLAVVGGYPTVVNEDINLA